MTSTTLSPEVNNTTTQTNKVSTILIVDDFKIYQRLVKMAFDDAIDFKVIGTVSNGLEALAFIKSKQAPDFVMLDLEMPEMDGLQTLQAIQKLNDKDPDTNIRCIMLSSYTQKNSEVLTQVLDHGAVGIICKPNENNVNESIKKLKDSIFTIIRPLANLKQKPIKTDTKEKIQYKDFELEEPEMLFLQEYLKKACGLIFSPENLYLYKYKIWSVIESHGYSGYKNLCAYLRLGNKELKKELISELTIHETTFFRDRHPFEAFSSTVLPWLEKIINERKNNLPARKGAKARIWCAASSTGQEPYSLAILIKQFTKNASIDMNDIKILATDICTEVLSVAMLGCYSCFDIDRGYSNGMPPYIKDGNFKKIDNNYKINSDIRNIVEFKRCNMVENFAHLGAFDVIYCRNILIYFDNKARLNIIAQFLEALSPNGILVLGAQENILDYENKIDYYQDFETLQVGQTMLYRKK